MSNLSTVRTLAEQDAHQAAQAQRIAGLLARVEATRGAMADLRDFCEGLGYPNAQHARPEAVVRRVDQRYPGGVDAFLSNYDG